MRNIKLLWGLAACLLAAVLVLGLLLIREMGKEAPDAGQQKDNPGHDRVIAKLGGREFTLSLLQERLLDKFGTEEINQLLDREALRLEAEQRNIKISREEIDSELRRMQNGYDSEELFYESMNTQLGLSKEEIREDVYYKLLTEKIATLGVTVSEQDIDTYIKEHPEEFQLNTLLRIQIVVNKTADQAWRTIELFKGGTDFAQLARDRSLDSVTAAEGGDMGWVDASDPFVPDEILKAAQGLTVGQISSPIETADGFAVILLKDKKEQAKGTVLQIRDSVRKMLALQKAPPIQDLIQSLRIKFNAEIMDPELKKQL